MKKGEIAFYLIIALMILVAAYFFYSASMALFSEKYQIKERPNLIAPALIQTPPELPRISLKAEENPKTAITLLKWTSNFNSGKTYLTEAKTLCGVNASNNWVVQTVLKEDSQGREFSRKVNTGSNNTAEYRVKTFGPYGIERISNTVRVYYNKSNCSYISPQILEIFPTPTYGKDNQILFVWLRKEKPQEIKRGMKLQFIIETTCCKLTGNGTVRENSNWWEYPTVFEILVDFDTDLREKKFIGQFKPNYELDEKERYTITVQ